MSFLESVVSGAGLREISAVVLALILVIWAFNLVTDPLRKVPGPFWTRFTKFWLVRQYVKGDFHKTNIELLRNMVKFPRFLLFRHAFTVEPQVLLFASLQIFIVLMIPMPRKLSTDMEQISQRLVLRLVVTYNIATNVSA